MSLILIQRIVTLLILSVFSLMFGCEKTAPPANAPRVAAVTVAEEFGFSHTIPLPNNTPGHFVGHYGSFSGDVRVSVIASNSVGCKIQFLYIGMVSSTIPIRLTNLVDCPYPNSTKVKLDYLGKVGIRFLTQREIEDLKL